MQSNQPIASYPTCSMSLCWFSAAASFLAFECCLCTTTDRHGMVRVQPLYAMVRYCPDCHHSVCGKHWSLCGLCEGCCFEQHGSHFEEKP